MKKEILIHLQLPSTETFDLMIIQEAQCRVSRRLNASLPSPDLSHPFGFKGRGSPV